MKTKNINPTLFSSIIFILLIINTFIFRFISIEPLNVSSMILYISLKTFFSFSIEIFLIALCSFVLGKKYGTLFTLIFLILKTAIFLIFFNNPVFYISYLGIIFIAFFCGFNNIFYNLAGIIIYFFLMTIERLLLIIISNVLLNFKDFEKFQNYLYLIPLSNPVESTLAIISYLIHLIMPIICIFLAYFIVKKLKINYR